MENQTNNPTPESIFQIGTGFWASKILLAAVNFELFTKLAIKKKMTAQEIKSDLNLQCSDRNVFDFLDTLVGFGFLTRNGLLEKAAYSNSPNTDTFLDKNKPSYIGGLLEMMNNRLYKFWGDLEEGLKTGKAQNEAKFGVNIFEEVYKDPNELKGFVNAMSGAQMGAFIAFAQKFDFSKSKTLVDAGGSAGLLSIHVAKNHQHMTCTTVDLPQVEPIAKETIERFQLSDRVKTKSGDFFADALPSADIVVMGNILHDWDEQQKLALMKKAFDALPAGGRFVAIENVIDEDRRQNVFGLMMSLNMLIETGTGFDYTFSDFTRWAKSIGFKSTTILPLTGPTSAAIAQK